MKLFDVYPINDITIVRAMGSRVWDDQDREYLDMYGGHAVISIGHTHPHYVHRITEQLNRVGFYSNVDRSFLPASARPRNEAVSIYIERAFVGGQVLTQQEVDDYSKSVVQELQEWGYITDAEVVDPTWIDVAYTWADPRVRLS